MNPHKGLSTPLLLYAFGYYLCLALTLGIVAVVAMLILAAMIIGMYAAVIASIMLGYLLRYVCMDLLLLTKGIRLKTGGYPQIELKRDDASGIFEVADDLMHRMGIKSRFRVFLSNGDSWMPLNDLLLHGNAVGLRISTGDLAVLSVDEIRPLLAFQLAYVKYTERGINGFVLRTIMRMHQLLDAIGAEDKGKNGPISFGTMMRRGLIGIRYHLLGRYIAYTRFYEESADALVRDVCGDPLYNSMVLKTSIANHLNRQIHPIEHIRSANAREDYWAWLRSKLAPADSAITNAVKGLLLYMNISEEYSVGYVMAERIRAAAADLSVSGYAGIPAYASLCDPAGLAARLSDESARVMRRLESEDSGAITTGAGSVRLNLRLLVRALGVFCLVFGVITMFGFLSNIHGAGFSDFLSTNGSVTFAMAMVAVAGISMIRWAAPDQTEIPVPDYGLWVRSSKRPRPSDEFNAAVVGVRDELKAKFPAPKTGVHELLRIGLNALEECDYARAYAASSIALEYKHRLRGALYVRAISSIPTDQVDSRQSLDAAYSSGTGVNKWFYWVMAWAGLNQGLAEFAERNLILALRKTPGLLPLYLYRAHVRYGRAKYLSALDDMEKAIAGGCRSAECMMLYADILKAVGKTREAIAVLDSIDPDEGNRQAILHRLMAANVLAGNAAEASRIVGELESAYASAETFGRIAFDFLDGDDLESARSYFLKAYDMSPAPQTLIELARLEQKRYDYPQCRDYLQKALGMLGESDLTPDTISRILNDILAGMMAVERPVDTSSLWSVSCTVEESDILLREQTILVYTMNINDAEKHIRRIFGAIYPDLPREQIVFKEWTQVPGQSGPHAPGVSEWRISRSILNAPVPDAAQMQPEASDIDAAGMGL